jgi:hypothetical protein
VFGSTDLQFENQMSLSKLTFRHPRSRNIQGTGCFFADAAIFRLKDWRISLWLKLTGSVEWLISPRHLLFEPRLLSLISKSIMSKKSIRNTTSKKKQQFTEKPGCENNT